MRLLHCASHRKHISVHPVIAPSCGYVTVEDKRESACRAKHTTLLPLHGSGPSVTKALYNQHQTACKLKLCKPSLQVNATLGSIGKSRLGARAFLASLHAPPKNHRKRGPVFKPGFRSRVWGCDAQPPGEKVRGVLFASFLVCLSAEQRSSFLVRINSVTWSPLSLSSTAHLLRSLGYASLQDIP